MNCINSVNFKRMVELSLQVKNCEKFETFDEIHCLLPHSKLLRAILVLSGSGRSKKWRGYFTGVLTVKFWRQYTYFDQGIMTVEIFPLKLIVVDYKRILFGRVLHKRIHYNIFFH